MDLSKNIDLSNNIDLSKNINDTKLTGELGSTLYSSPEQLMGNEYDYRTDIYSLGIILFELLNNFTTEMEKNIEITKLKNDNLDKLNNETKYVDELKFIKILINPDYKKRPNTQKILEMLG